MISESSVGAMLAEMDVPAEVRAQLRAYAQSEGFDLQAVVIAALESYLNPIPPAAAQVPAGWIVRRHQGERWF